MKSDASPEEQAAAKGLSVEQWLKKPANENAAGEGSARETETLADFLSRSPFAGSELDLERVRDFPRPVESESAGS